MPDRVVRVGILTSESVNRLSWPAEVFYRRLMSEADDYGRYDGRPSILRARLYPLKLDRVSERDVETWLRACEDVGLVTVYTIESRQYVEIRKFDQRLRAKNSKWPPPPSSADICQHMSSNATESETESESSLSPPSEEIVETSVSTRVPFEEILNLYHRELPELPRCLKLTKTRKGHIRQRWVEDLPDMDAWRKFFALVKQSRFLTGKAQARNGRPFRASLDWLTKQENCVKVCEGKYE